MTPDQKLERVPGAEQPKLTGYEKRELQGHKKRVCTLAWSSSGRKLASGSTDAAIRVWSIEPHAQVGRAERSDAELKGHTSTISHVAWKPGSESVLASAGDKSIRFWDAKANKGTSVVPMNVSNSFITWSPDGNNVAAIDNDSTLSIIDVRKAKVVKTHKFKEDVWDIHWGPTIQHFMLATDKGSVDVVSMPTMEPLWSLTGHTSIALCFSITNKYKYLVSGGGDALVALWDLDDQVCIRTWAHMDTPLRAVSLSHDNQMVAYATDSGDAIPPIEIVSTRMGEKLESIKLRAQCDSLAWSPTHNVLAFCDEVVGERPRDTYQSQSVPNIGVVGIYAPPKG